MVVCGGVRLCDEMGGATGDKYLKVRFMASREVQYAGAGKDACKVDWDDRPFGLDAVSDWKRDLRDVQFLVGIKRLLDDLEVTAAKVRVTTAKQNLVLFSVKDYNARVTAEEKAKGGSELKERSTLLMGIPNEHQLKFNSIKDAKSLLQAVEKRFGGNDATKKNLLKQQYENFYSILPQSTSGTNGAVNIALGATTARTQATTANSTTTDNLSDAVICASVADGYANMRTRRLVKNIRKKFSVTCRAPRNQENRNRETTRRVVPVETATSNALISCDGSGYDWSDQVEEGPTNFALMAYSSTSSNSKVSTDSNCSSSCLENVKILKEQHEQLLKDLRTSKLNAIAYKTDLESVEARLLVYKKNKSVYEEDIKDEAESKPKIENKTVKLSFAKIEFVKSKKQVKPPRKTTVKQEHAEYDESNTYVLERFNTTAGNPVKKILLKLNLSDHRLFKDGGGVKEFQRSFRHSDTERLSRSDEVLKLKNFKKDVALKFFKTTIQERYEHVGSEITNPQDGKVSRWRRDCAWLMISRCSRSQCQIQVQGTSSI
ncbi:hypothetical protein Tco_0991890 [Tanacetum coccineum]|uniref:Uncharacterized protein n=1 Tax=Tanacetum coccineum TaxID=301880 RepID=A0ABQ5F0I4_9ASTR